MKECYWYLDATPTHSYLHALYRYPAARVPVRRRSRAENARRGRDQPEFELRDTGVFDDERYFDVDVEYAKAEPGRHPDPDHGHEPRPRRRRRLARAADALVPQHLGLGSRDAPSGRRSGSTGATSIADQWLRIRRSRSSAIDRSSADGDARAAVHRERDQRRAALRRRRAGHAVRQGRHRHGASSHGDVDAVNPTRRRAPRRPRTTGSCSQPGRVAGRCGCALAPAVERAAVRTDFDELVRPRGGPRPTRSTPPLGAEADSDDERRVQRQAFAGLLWSKQFYHFDVERLARRRPGQPPPPRRRRDAAATPTGASSTTPTCSRCRTSGSTRGSRRGTSPSTASRSRSIDPDVRQGPARAC